jgi:hypothetical protein
MASTDRITRLVNIRDQLEKELENETLRRLNLTAAGNPPPTSYTVGGKQVQWNEYLQTMLAQIQGYNDLIARNAPYELPIQGY